MRKSKPFSRSRLAVAAGLGTGAVTAALLVAPNAAFAAISVSKTVAAPGDSITVTDDITGSATPFPTTVKVELQSAVCNAKYVASSTSALPATTTAPGGASATVTFTVPNNSAGTNGQLKKWYVCAYDGSTAGTSPLVGSSSLYTLWVGIVPTLSPSVGITGGGDTVTITPAANNPIFTGVTTIGAVFSTTDCLSTYGTPTTGTTSTVTKNVDGTATLMTPTGVSSNTGAMTAYNICLYNGAAASSALISSAVFNVGQLALSQSTGPWGGLNGLNITSPNQFLAGIDAPGVNFTSSACAGTYADLGTTGSVGGGTLTGAQSVGSTKIRKLTDSRLAVTVPALFTNAPSSATTWNICVYASQTAGSALLASAQYTLTTVPAATAVSPKAGPALGGSKITVSGTALPTDATKISATLGGLPLTNIVSLSATAFTAVTPQHAPANNVALVLTTDAGSFTLSGAYSFTAALKVSPNTAPNTKAVDLVVNGVGFQSANWGNTLLTGSHIVLTRGTYDPSANGSSNRYNPPIAECGNPLVLSDTEVICTLDLTKRMKSDGTDYIAAAAPSTITGTIGTTAGSRVLVDSGAGFTDDLVGTTVTSANVPVGTTVLRYIDANTVLISGNATGTGTTGNATFSSPLIRTITTSTSNASTALVVAAGTPLLKADEGRILVSPTGLVGGQKLLTYTNATTGVLNANASAASTTEATQVLSPTLPVPEGAYNLIYVSNTAVGANGSDVTYIQSMISSGSTFTVSSF
jgi:hypothetical protein